MHSFVSTTCKCWDLSLSLSSSYPIMRHRRVFASCTRTAVDAKSRQYSYISAMAPPTFQRTRSHSFGFLSVITRGPPLPVWEVRSPLPHRKPSLLRKFLWRSTIMAIDPGTRAARFLPQGRRYSSVAKYIARLGHYLHKYVESFHEANRLLRSDSKMAAITEVSKLLSFCACL